LPITFFWRPMSNRAAAVRGTADIQLPEGLFGRPLSIPSKYFYDDRGSALFDAICDLPEYYPTRSEQALLDKRAEEIAEISQAKELVELGAGTARKTRHLIRSLMARGRGLHYAPLDISRYALEQAESSLSAEFPDLHITGMECDYTETLEPLKPDPGCLAVFLGSTIGNFSPAEGVSFLRRLRDRLAPGDWFLMGVDLVKPVEILHAAYNDAAGVTAEFNKNILNVVNEMFGGDFDPANYEHLAFFNKELSQIEMHLVARENARVSFRGSALVLEIGAGERIKTEISRKFTRESTCHLLSSGGFDLRHWFPSENGYFALALAGVKGEEITTLPLAWQR